MRRYGSMTGAECCASSGHDLKNTRNCDSTPARTVDCDEGKMGVVVVSESWIRSELGATNYGRCHTHHNCRGLVSRKLVLCDTLHPLPRHGILLFEKDTMIGKEGIRV